MKKTFVNLLVVALGLISSLAYASSPEPPVDCKVEALETRDALGRLSLVRLTLSSRDEGEYRVKVRRASEESSDPGASAKRQSVGVWQVRRDEAAVLEEELDVAGARDKVVRARYEIEIENEKTGERHILVVDQAFAVQPDGSLEAIDFAEEMRLSAGKPPMPVQDDDLLAGGGQAERKDQ